MSQRRASLFITLAIAFITILTACKSNRAANDAIAALKKIQAATQVGISYQHYNQLVLEAKAVVNEASSKLPDSELKQALQATMDAYADAAEGWRKAESVDMSLLGIQRVLYLKDIKDAFTGQESTGERLRQKYKIKTFYEEFDEGAGRSSEFTRSALDFLTQDRMLNTIWKEAEKHLNRASELL